MTFLTKFVLKRPVTTLMAILCLIYFGYSSVTNSKLELMSDMDMPMEMVITSYEGASPEDVNDLVTTVIEDKCSSLTGLKSITSNSSEGTSTILLEYDYGTDTSDAYDELKKEIDLIKTELPDGCDDPVIVEMDMNSTPDITLAIENEAEDNVYNYVNDEIAPSFEKLSSVASVDVMGGTEEYIRIELNEEKMQQYGITMTSLQEDIANADISYPAGEVDVGNEELSLSTTTTYDTVELLKTIPLTTESGDSIYLEDVADIGMAEEEQSSIARYDGKDTVAVYLTKKDSSTSVDLSDDAKEEIEALEAENPDLHISIIHDAADNIIDSLMDVAQTLVLAVGISMFIIWLFFGDLKASLITGSSIPISILTTLILMNAVGFSLNTITLSTLSLGVGMMVDNSIVVLESCFRVTATHEKRPGMVEYMEDALKGTQLVANSVMGGTVTTCVVFIPLALLSGMTGQIFKSLGWTIVFCLVASLISALTIVPLCYVTYKPQERMKAPLSSPIRHLQDDYRRLMRALLPHRLLVIILTVVLLVFSCTLVPKIGMELMASDDQGQIKVTVETRPGLKVEEIDKILKGVEDIIAQDEDLDHYMASYGSSSGSTSSDASITAYLKDDRKRETSEVVADWKKELADVEDCNISVSMSSSMDMMSGASDEYEVILRGTDYDELKEVSEKIVDELRQRDDLTKIHSSDENAAPVLEIHVDTTAAKAEGLSASDVGSAVRQMVTGIDVMDMEVDNEDIEVYLKYPEGTYDTLNDVKNMVLYTTSGRAVALTDIADIEFVDSPSSITREDKEYEITIDGYYTDKATTESQQEILSEVVEPNLTGDIHTGLSSTDSSMNEEFADLYSAIITAIFLVFVVMAAQFESVRYSIMVMTTIPFSMIGSFILLYLTGVKISMTSLVGFLMLFGTAVNNGILYVDTVNEYRSTMPLREALIEGAATRIRPMLMTTLTTIFSMLPLALAMGNTGSSTQGLAIVNIGGLTTSTILCLLMLPGYYVIMSGRDTRRMIREEEKEERRKKREARKGGNSDETKS